MTRSQFITRLLKGKLRAWPRKDVEKMVVDIFEEVAAAMARGERAELRGFGTFSVRTYDARTGSDPRSGKIIHIDERYAPFFRPGNTLLDRLN